MSFVTHIRKMALDRRRLSAAIMLGLFLGVFTVALSEALHRVLHAEACQPQHECAVTMLQGGLVENAVTAVAPVVLYAFAFTAPTPVSIFVPSTDLSLPPSCGPPALLS